MVRRRGLAVAAQPRLSAVFNSRLRWGILILVLFVLLGLGITGGLLSYGIITARNDNETVTPASYLLSSFENLNFTDSAGGEHEGWLLVGLKRAPVIILCHGYNSNRSEVLSLGTLLRDNHFNVYLFNFGGPKTKERFSDLGTRQTGDLLGAIETITQHPVVNPRRVGLYGTTLGGYAALAAAEQNPLVKALVVDTIYDTPRQMFDEEVDRRLGGSSQAFRLLAGAEFRLFTWGTKPPDVRANLSKLAGIPKLFISGRDMPPLAAATEDLYNHAPQPKRLLVLEHSQTTLASSGEKKEYENQVLTFFLQNLTPRAN